MYLSLSRLTPTAPSSEGAFKLQGRTYVCARLMPTGIGGAPTAMGSRPTGLPQNWCRLEFYFVGRDDHIAPRGAGVALRRA